MKHISQTSVLHHLCKEGQLPSQDNMLPSHHNQGRKEVHDMATLDEKTIRHLAPFVVVPTYLPV